MNAVLGELRSVRYPVEIALLVALCFFLPLFEAPKNLLWAAYAATWLANRVRARDFGGRWDLWDTLIVVWIASAYVGAAFAGLHGSEWRGATDVLRYGSILWMVKRARYSGRELEWMLGTLILSAVIGLAAGYVRLWTGMAKSGWLELNSVGHVNHTAIYVAIMLGVCASWVFACWKAWPANTRTLALATGAMVLVSLVVTASRGAVGVGLAMLPLLAIAWWPRWRAPLIASASAVAVVTAVVVLGGAGVIRKHEENVQHHNVLSFRDGIWRMGLAGFERYPVFGVGMDNYGLITQERVQQWRRQAGKDYDPARYVHFPHGHSIYVNTLAERGLFGFAVVIAVLAAWAFYLVRYRPRPADSNEEWLFWGSAACAWLITVGAGTVNTTLHHEHGILAVFLLGAWLSRLMTRRAS
jgi:O-antigen ligase